MFFENFTPKRDLSIQSHDPFHCQVRTSYRPDSRGANTQSCCCSHWDCVWNWQADSCLSGESIQVAVLPLDCSHTSPVLAPRIAFRAPLAHLRAQEQDGGCQRREGEEQTHVRCPPHLVVTWKSNASDITSGSSSPCPQLAQPQKDVLQCDLHCKTFSGAQGRHAGFF